MLVSAQMASVHLSDKSTALAVAEVTWKTMHDASWVTFGCALWVLLFACLLPRTSHRNVLVNLTRLLCFAEIMQALATVVCPTSILSSRSLMYLRFSAMYFGILASRFYAAALVSGFALSLSWGEYVCGRSLRFAFCCFCFFFVFCCLMHGCVCVEARVLRGTSRRSFITCVRTASARMRQECDATVPVSSVPCSPPCGGCSVAGFHVRWRLGRQHDCRTRVCRRVWQGSWMRLL